MIPVVVATQPPVLSSQPSDHPNHLNQLTSPYIGDAISSSLPSNICTLSSVDPMLITSPD